MFVQKFAFSLVVFCSHEAISLCLLCFRIYIGFFCGNGFPISLTVRSVSSFEVKSM